MQPHWVESSFTKRTLVDSYIICIYVILRIYDYRYIAVKCFAIVLWLTVNCVLKRIRAQTNGTNGNNQISLCFYRAKRSATKQ